MCGEETGLRLACRKCQDVACFYTFVFSALCDWREGIGHILRTRDLRLQVNVRINLSCDQSFDEKTKKIRIGGSLFKLRESEYWSGFQNAKFVEPRGVC